MTRLLSAALITAVSLASSLASANGRVPGATGLAIHPTDERQLLLGLTYGLALTRDGSASWTWICEEQIEGNGSDLDPSIVMTGDGTLIAISLTNGGVLVSRDDGCSFVRAPGLQGNRGMDLTLDPSEPGHILALMSTLIDVVDGRPRYSNLIAHSLDHGASWAVLAELPGDFLAQTIEVAPSDVGRIYVSGVAAGDPLQAIVERSDHGGLDWSRTTVQLPRGSGGLYLSGIHPKDPDRLWFRVPGRGDVYGLLPARLWLSPDGGASFQPIADTQAGMLGFALSPDGDRIAFGGRQDGLMLGPSDGSAPASKIADLLLSCLRWRASGLYVCGSEPADPYSLAHAADPTQGFVPLWQRANTCREACAASSSLELKCRAPWAAIAPLVGAESEVCDVSSVMPDAGVDAGSGAAGSGSDSGSIVDASSATPQPTAADRRRSSSGCSVTPPSGLGRPWWLALVLLYLAARTGRLTLRPRARSRCFWQLAPAPRIAGARTVTAARGER